jgi:hypothetical protein
MQLAFEAFECSPAGAAVNAAEFRSTVDFEV